MGNLSRICIWEAQRKPAFNVRECKKGSNSSSFKNRVEREWREASSCRGTVQLLVTGQEFTMGCNYISSERPLTHVTTHSFTLISAHGDALTSPTLNWEEAKAASSYARSKWRRDGGYDGWVERGGSAMSVFQNNPRKSLRICPMRQQLRPCWQTRRAGVQYGRVRGGGSWTKSLRYHEITTPAADPDVATPLAAPPRLAPDVLQRGAMRTVAVETRILRADKQKRSRSVGSCTGCSWVPVSVSPSFPSSSARVCTLDQPGHGEPVAPPLQQTCRCTWRGPHRCFGAEKGLKERPGQTGSSP